MMFAKQDTDLYDWGWHRLSSVLLYFQFPHTRMKKGLYMNYERPVSNYIDFQKL